MAEAIHAINSCGRPVFALDVPSGLNADSGEVMGAAIRADCTISFVALKTGLFLRDGPEHVGRLLFDDLEVSPPTESDNFQPLLQRLGEAEIARALPRRPREANKGDFGRVLIVGGGPGMPGAVRLAGESCLRVGRRPGDGGDGAENLTAIVAGRPELIVHAAGAAEQLRPLLQAADVVAVGTGSGPGRLGANSPWSRCLAAASRWCSMPMRSTCWRAARARPARVGADAAPGRGRRDCSAPMPRRSRPIEWRRSRALQRRHPVRSSCSRERARWSGADGPHPRSLRARQPGHGGAGMGDVLTGVIAGILAQCRDPWRAARAGVMAHALAGDELARERHRGVLALEVAEALGHWVGR